LNSVQSDMYSKSKAQPFPIGTTGPSTSFDLSKTLGNLKDSLSSSGATATIKGFEKVDGRDAYRVALDLPLSKLNDLLATQGGSAAANMTVDSASLDYWVYSDTLQPAKVEIKGSAADFGKIDMTITLTKYNQKITITAPPADKIQDGS
jgi:hypothetical protein